MGEKRGGREERIIAKSTHTATWPFVVYTAFTQQERPLLHEQLQYMDKLFFVVLCKYTCGLTQ